MTDLSNDAIINTLAQHPADAIGQLTEEPFHKEHHMNYQEASRVLNEVIQATPNINYTTSRKSGDYVRQGHSENGNHGHYFIEAASLGCRQKVIMGYQEGRTTDGKPWRVTFGPRHTADLQNRAKFVSSESNTDKDFVTSVEAILHFVEVYKAISFLG